MPRWGFTVDLERCVGCQGCVIACKAENGTPPGIHWMKVLEKEEVCQASLTLPSWNQLVSWLRELDLVRQQVAA